jgi:S1-C subfamily serine protease
MTWWHDDEPPARTPPPPPPRRRVPSDPTVPHHEPTAVRVPPETIGGPGGVGSPPTVPGGGGGGTAAWPPASGPGRPRPPARGSHAPWVLVAVLVVAVGLGGAIAWGATNASSIFPTSSVRSSAPAKQVSQQKANPSAIAGQSDPGIVDVEANLSLQNGEAAGTGMVMSSNGLILTNNHVVDEATSLSVKISNGSKTYPAKVVGTDVTDDVAVIQAEGASGLTPLTFGDSSSLSVGDSVVAIGNALNKPGPPAVTDGSVTALNRSITVNSDLGGTESLSDLIEHNAQLQPGNSGGPLFDAAGQVVGMNTAAASGAIPQQGTNDGFSIPIDDALTIAHQIESGHSGGNVTVGPRGFLGVEVEPTSSGSGGGGQFGGGGGFGGGFGGRFGGRGGFENGGGGTQSGDGVLVQAVVPNTPAASAGITAGDQILSVDGTSVNSESDLTAAIGSKHPGDTIQVTWVDQSGNQQTATVRLITNPAAD